MKTQTHVANKGLGPIVCIMIEGSNPDTTQGNNPDGNEALQDEENLFPPEVMDNTIPAGEEENMPDPEEFEERQRDPNLDDMPMEEPVPDLDEIEQEEDIDDLDIDPTEDAEEIEEEPLDDEIL
jgi:hypothetical protein